MREALLERGIAKRISNPYIQAKNGYAKVRLFCFIDSFDFLIDIKRDM